MRAVNYPVTGFLLLIFVSAVPAYGQKLSKGNIITGYVTDVNQYPVINALVVIDKKTTRVVTDDRGFYKVRVRPYSKSIGVLSFKHGLCEELINGRRRINFTFQNSVLSHNNIAGFNPGDEEINVGYGTVKRRNLTTSVGKVYARDIRYASLSSIFDLLQGTVPGVFVHDGNVRIRGAPFRPGYDPLFIVDGSPVTSIADIPPQMVESIEVLKGPASSVYGSRGANGAVIIDLIGAHSKPDSSALAAAPKVPVAETREATDIKDGSATLNGIVNARNIPTDITFEYGTTPGYGTTSVPAVQGMVSANIPACVSADITGLHEGVTYYFRVVASNSQGKTTGVSLPFKYSGKLPSAETWAATKSSPRTAQLNGIVKINGVPGTVSFEYGPTTGYGTTVEAVQSPVTAQASAWVSANVSGLDPGTLYHYRIVVTNDAGTTCGKDQTFKSEYVFGEELFGGYIFYVDETGEHGLVCAPTCQSLNAPWSNTTPPGAAGRTVGTGNQNTADIVLGCPQQGIAARLCYDLEMNGYSDWFLPSIDELFLIYKNLYSKEPGRFEDCFYWSSTQDNYGVWVMNFYYGTRSNHERNETGIKTLAVRAF